MEDRTASNKIAWKSSLSTQLMVRALIGAVVVGITLSCFQVMWEAGKASSQIDDDANQLLAVIEDAATQAVYSIDADLAERVLEGLFARRAVKYAGIFHPNKLALAEKQRPAVQKQFRWITDAILGKEKTFQIDLQKASPTLETYGMLIVKLDTWYVSSLLLERSANIFITTLLSAFILALVLYLGYHFYLTQPLKSLTTSLQKINPAKPGLQSLPTPLHHQSDEVGFLVSSANDLLDSIAKHQQERHAAEARVIRLSQYDALTGLPTRGLFNQYLKSAIQDAQSHNQSLAVFCIGIDDFKSINEQYGYAKGDKLLQAFAERLIKLRDYIHTSCRLAGDQFALVLYNLASSYTAAAFAEGLLEEMHRPFIVDDSEISLRCTIGISIFPEDSEDADRVLQKAEQTMLHAKLKGASQFHFYVAALDTEIRSRKNLERDLAQAIKKQQFSVVYQPQIRLQDSQIVGAEILIRWRHPERGWVPPDVFIPVAESTGKIFEIGEWVLSEACKQIKAWQKVGLNLLVAVNVSAHQLKREGFIDTVQDILSKHQVAPEQIELEVTETSFMENIEDAVQILKKLNSLGLMCAVDDFGTGYSSLSYLKQLPVAKIKIDKQFVRDLMADDDDTQIVHAIIQLGRSLRLTVVAEGVETVEQQEFLLKDGCEIAQGYLFSKPISANEFTRYVAERIDIDELAGNS